MQRLARRRAVFGGILAGGVAAPLAVMPTGAAAATTWTPRAVRVSSLRPGDLVVGPEGAACRLAEVRRLAGGRFRLRVTDDVTGRVVPLNDRWETSGVAGSAALMVLARDTSASAVLFGVKRLFDGGPARSSWSTLRLRRGTAADWSQADPVLEPGEPGFEYDTLRLKIGDGGARWSDLPYVAGAGSGTPETSARSHFVGDDLTLPRPAYAGPIDWITSVDGVPAHIQKGDWITRVQTVVS